MLYTGEYKMSKIRSTYIGTYLYVYIYIVEDICLVALIVIVTL